MVFGKLFPRWKRAEPPPSSEPTALSGKRSSGGGGAGGALTVNEFVARTKRCKEKGLEPTKPELYAYARYLGIDPFADGDLMWLVDEALKAPLPAEWTEHHDGADRVFYYNSLTHSSSWTHPLEELHRETYKTIVHFRSGGLSKQEQNAKLDDMRAKVEDLERETHRELQAWSDHVDEDGQKFFYNREKQRSFWTDPRLAPCHSLYLQMKVLRALSEVAGRKWVEPLSPDFKRQLKLTTALGEPPANARGDLSERSERHEGKKKKNKDQEQLVPLSARSTEAPSLSARSQSLGPLGQPPDSGGEEVFTDSSPERSEKKRSKKKKKHDKSQESEMEHVSGSELDARSTSLGPQKVSSPEDVRAPAGVSPRSFPPMGERSMRLTGRSGPLGNVTSLGPIGGIGPLDDDRRPAKVRPGIKLVPLRDDNLF